jgi:hypothetical protein
VVSRDYPLQDRSHSLRENSEVNRNRRKLAIEMKLRLLFWSPIREWFILGSLWNIYLIDWSSDTLSLNSASNYRGWKMEMPSQN